MIAWEFPRRSTAVTPSPRGLGAPGRLEVAVGHHHRLGGAWVAVCEPVSHLDLDGVSPRVRGHERATAGYSTWPEGAAARGAMVSQDGRPMANSFVSLGGVLK